MPEKSNQIPTDPQSNPLPINQFRCGTLFTGTIEDSRWRLFEVAGLIVRKKEESHEAASEADRDRVSIPGISWFEGVLAIKTYGDHKIVFGRTYRLMMADGSKMNIILNECDCESSPLAGPIYGFQSSGEPSRDLRIEGTVSA